MTTASSSLPCICVLGKEKELNFVCCFGSSDAGCRASIVSILMGAAQRISQITEDCQKVAIPAKSDLMASKMEPDGGMAQRGPKMVNKPKTLEFAALATLYP